jgi:hypothetical protein
MTEKQIHKGNILIAMFMTEEREVLMHDLKKAGTVESMQYHESWEWLIPVIRKIKTVVTEEEELRKGLQFHLNPYTYDMEQIFAHCIEFIKWHNEHY